MNPSSSWSLTASDSTPQTSTSPMKAFPRTAQVLTHDEAVLEVQQMLDAQRTRLQSPTRALKSSGTSIQSFKSVSHFSFAPLRDPQMLSEAALVMTTTDSDRNSEGDNVQDEEIGHSEHGDHVAGLSDENDKDRTSAKYFGPVAKQDYYRTYRELHGKTHLFVQAPQAHVSGLRSSSSCPTTLDNNSFTISTLSPLKTSSKRRHARHRRVPPLELQSEAVDVSIKGQGGSLSTQSPRVLFLASCLAKSRPALALVLRKAHSRAFNFSHQGLGDDFIVDFAACLPEIPLVEAINVSANSLSDHAINALLHALENKPNLSYLNVSGNGIGPKSAASLRVYIASSLCTLKTLVMDDADVDDAECALFMLAFEGNKSVEVLSLKSNSIGQPQLQQSMNRTGTRGSSPVKTREHSTTTGGQPTGGEAIGSMLNVNLTIQHLDLSWNALRAPSAVPIASALQLNYHLRELTLTHNSIGDGGAIAFGQALRSNSTLQKLRLEFNAIGSKGALGLSSGLAVNLAMLELALDGNPIGLEAAKSLMRASCNRPASSSSGSAFCRLSLIDCNLTSSAATTATKKQKKRPVDVTTTTTTSQLVVFDPSSPAGNYVLNLADPYENVVAHELFRLAGDETGSSSFRFTRIEFAPVVIGSVKPSTVKLEHVQVSRKADNTLNSSEIDEEKEASRSQRHRSKSAVAMLFKQVDTDNSGFVDQLELLQAMRAHGISILDTDLSRLLREYDYDSSGSLQAHEFADLFFRCGFAMIDSDGSGSLDHREVSRVLSLMGIHDVSDAEIARMLARYDLDNSGEIDEQEFLAFLKAEILRNSDNDSNGDGGEAGASTVEIQWIVRDVASGTAFTIGTSGTLTLEMVQDTASIDEDSDPTTRTRLGRRISDAFVSKLMANIQGISKNQTEQREFLHLVLEESELLFTCQQALALLEKQAGSMKTQRRRLDGVCRLLPQMASRQDAANLVAQLVDPKDQWLERFALKSRLGQWFPVLLGSLTNSYTFDLDKEMDRAALKRLAQLAQGEKLFSKNRSGRSDTSQHGDWENFRNARVNGKPVLLTSSFILNTLLGPSPSLSTCLGSIGATTSSGKTIVSFHYVSTQRPPRGTQPLSCRRFDQLQRVLQHQLPLPEDLRSFFGKVWADDVERDLSVEEEEAKQRVRMRWDVVRRSVLKRREDPSTSEAVSRQHGMMEQLRSSLEQVQSRLVLLEMLVADRWVSCQQAQEVVDVFPNTLHARAKAACVAFSRVIDLHNFIQIYDGLSLEDQRECVRRLGWLNVFDPSQPDRDYPPLDLGVREERELVQILAQLAVREGSSCWCSASYRVGPSAALPESSQSLTGSSTSSEFPPPGWGNPDAIGSEALRHHGIVKLRFQSQREGQGEAGGDGEATGSLAERGAFRRELRRRVLCGTRLFL